MVELLYFSCWVQTRYQKSANLLIKMGKRTPTIIKNYLPGSKIHIFDTVVKTQMPIVQITFDQYQPKSFRLQNFKQHETEPHVQIIEDSRILFTYELLPNTQKIYEKCNFSIIKDCHEKLQTQKHYLCQGVKDFIRSEQQFLAQYERDEQVEQIRQLQAEESRIERDLCEEIINTKKYSISITKILLTVVIFVFFGFLVGRYDFNAKGNILMNLLNFQKSDKFQGKKVKTKKKHSKIKPKQKVKTSSQKKSKTKKKSQISKSKSK